jgi:hypothetical protein
MDSRWLRWVPALVWMAVIFYGSSLPVLPVDGQPNSGAYHTLGHIAEYGILALCLAWALGTGLRQLLLTVVIVALYAASDEFHQTFTPGRQGRTDQVLLDTLAAAGTLLVARGLLSLATRSGLVLSRQPTSSGRS